MWGPYLSGNLGLQDQSKAESCLIIQVTQDFSLVCCPLLEPQRSQWESPAWGMKCGAALFIPCASSSGFYRAADGEGKSDLPMKGSSHPALARGCSATCPKRKCNSWGKKMGMDVLNTRSSLGRKRSCTLHPVRKEAELMWHHFSPNAVCGWQSGGAR